jgi:D-alanyl-D-alanine dipeptidase
LANFGVKVLRTFAVPWARVAVADKLAHARRLLAPYDVGLREAWRSPERQKFLYDYYFATLDPEKSVASRRRLANRFFAPYDQKAPPGHSTGGAVDVWLLDHHGEPIGLDGPGRRFKSAPTFSRLLSPEIRAYRLLLHDAMAEAGFTNCRDEWWHYSFGDAGWAVRAGASECIYGAKYPDKQEYVARDEAFFAEFLANPPF